jgi:fumarylacetoacetase
MNFVPTSGRTTRSFRRVRQQFCSKKVDALEESWIASANGAQSGFSLENLPFCAFETKSEAVHLGVGIGNLIVDLHVCAREGLLKDLPGNVRGACKETTLNRLMSYGPRAVAMLRRTLAERLKLGVTRAEMDAVLAAVRPIEGAKFHKPVAVANYTDFYASLDHARRVGELFRPERPLLENYKWVPIGYHGRASSLVVGGAEIRRPCGQVKDAGDAGPRFEASRQLDYELELGAYVYGGNKLGERIALADADACLFGVTLVNDWSARDVQVWESQPLGPFLGKSFATSVSPWVVPMEALAPYRVTAAARAEGDPQPLEYLASNGLDGIDATLEVWLQTERMREAKAPAVKLSSSEFAGMYWTFAQMVAHHTSNGCNLLCGDLIASGTVSGPEAGSEGCLLEKTSRGAEPVRLPNGETRGFLEDGDEVILTGFCERDGLPRIGLGECRGRVLPASANSGV